MRVNDLEAGPVWLISSETLAQVPALHEAMGESWVERFMPKPLVSHSLFGTSLAQWIVWVRIPTQIGTHSAGKSTPVPIEIGTCSDANRHTLFRVS